VAIIFVAWRTKRLRAPALAALCIVLTVGGFSAFLVSKGLWWVPGSVIEKSDLPRDTMIGLRRLVKNFLSNAGTQSSALLASMAALSIAAAIRRHEKACYAVIAVIWMLVELMAFQLGWFRRYELWAVTSMCFMAIPAWAPIKEWSGSLRPLTLAACAVYAVVITSPYLLIFGRVPIGASNIYNQQYQMGLLVQQLGVRSIVVNDIGAVGWINPGVYVFDVVGLASPEVLERRRCCRADATWLEEVTDRHGVELILVYDNWVRARPNKWTKIGVLHLADKLVTPAGADVSIYTPNPEAATTLAAKLAAFATSLPPQAQLLLASGHPVSQ
jgi:hypothetical protein